MVLAGLVPLAVLLVIVWYVRGELAERPFYPAERGLEQRAVRPLPADPERASEPLPTGPLAEVGQVA